MSKGERIFVVVLIVFLGGPFLATTVGGRNTSLLDWVIGFAVAVVAGAGAYYLLGQQQARASARQEQLAHEILGSALPSGEALRAFAHGYTGPSRTGIILLFGVLADMIVNAARRQWYYVVLTTHYLALVQVDGKDKRPTGIHQVLRRDEVKGVDFKAGTLEEPKLVLQLAAERLELRLGSDMVGRAKELAAAWNGAV